MLFDADEAGIKATEKSIDLFIRADIDASFVTLPDRKDPFEFVMEKGLEQFQSQLNEARTMYVFKKKILTHRFKGSSTGSLSKIITALAETFGAVSSPVKRELFFKQISEDFSVSVSSLEKQTETKTPSRQESTKAAAQESSPLLQEAMKNIIKSVIMHPDLFDHTVHELHLDIIPEGIYKRIYSVCLEQYETEGRLIPEHLFSYIERTEEATQSLQPS